MSGRPRRPQWLGPVAIISLAQLFGTSLWFSANSATDGLMRDWGADAADIGWLTNAVQAGFIIGTLAISLGGIADRFRASAIFVVSALVGAAANAAFAWLAHDVSSGAAMRFVVGLSLAGIYPIGMKLIVSWEPQRTGPALALLVAMLTLGTALPQLLRASGGDLSWQWIVTASSLLALVGAAMIRALGDGPHLAAPVAGSARVRPAAVLAAFRIPQYRAAATGYFGHMWELYAFWTMVPLIVTAADLPARFPLLGAAGLTFAIIGIGALGSLIGGRLSRVLGSAPVALGALSLSGASILVFALFWQVLPAAALLVVLLVWGASVVADSPHFSALSATACPRALIGAALAIQNAIGFSISMVSISGATLLYDRVGPLAVWLLVPGPIAGLVGYAIARRGGHSGDGA
ncbi:MAG: MFS transporter [Acuticoccus sp.]